MPLKTHGLTHVALAARDPKRSASFYSQVFGCQVVHDGEDFVQLQTPGSRDVIVLERSSRNVGRSGGVAHIGFRLQTPDDIVAAVAAVEAAGGTVKERGEFCPGEPYLFAEDLDGYLVEIWYELPTPLDPQESRRRPASRTRATHTRHRR